MVPEFPWNLPSLASNFHDIISFFSYFLLLLPAHCQLLFCLKPGTCTCDLDFIRLATIPTFKVRQSKTVLTI